MTRPETAHVKVCEDADCILCASWREEMNARAAPHLLDRARTGSVAQTTLEDHG